MPDYRQFEWRVGRKVCRTLYAQIGPGPDDADHLIGVLDTRALAEEVAYAHNLLRAVRKASARKLTPAEEQEAVARRHLALQARAEGEAAAAEGRP